MANSRTYLKVPYIEKDSAKALGAKWDAINKKWYVPANLDITPFAKWYSEDTALESPIATDNPMPKKRKSFSQDYVGGMTYPNDENFTPYNGDDPPWS